MTRPDARRKIKKFPALADFAPPCAADIGFSRACIVTNELAELHQNGGIGTACSGLIETLSSHGVTVDVIYTGMVTGSAQAAAMAAFQKRGIKITFLQTLVPEDWMWKPRRVSYACFELVQISAAEIIFFNDYLGIGFYTCQARRLGIALRGVPIVTTIHGPTRWAHEIDQRPISTLEQEEICLLESKAIEYSDIVIGVSNPVLNWLAADGCALPPLTFVHKNALPRMEMSKNTAPPGAFKEIVFFARQDVRKGIHVFIGAIKLLAADHPDLQFTFLGKFSRIAGEHSGALALDELRLVKNKIAFRHDADRDAALAYLRGQDGVLVVIPSLDENSPCTVIECIEAGIPFIASDVGGIPELIAQQYHAEILFRPDAASLAARLRHVMRHGIRLPALAFEMQDVARQQMAFFTKMIEQTRAGDEQKAIDARHPLVSICITHYNRSKLLKTLLKALENQSYDAIEIIIIDDGSTNAEDVAYFDSLKTHKYPLKTKRIANSYLGAARNEAARLASGDYIKFQDDDNIPFPTEIETFVQAVAWSGADIITCFSYFFKTPVDLKKKKSFRDVEYLPLGASLPLSLFKNEYGDANALVKRSVFDALGGFSELRGIGAEDYEFFSRAEIAGYQIRVIPKPLFHYRVNAGGMLQTTSVYGNAKRARQAFTSRKAPWVDRVIELAHNTHLVHQINEAAWYAAGRRQFGQLHQQLLPGDPNEPAALSRFAALAEKYHRLADQMLVAAGEVFADPPLVIALSEVSDVELVAPVSGLPDDFALMQISHNGVLVHPLTGRETNVRIGGIVPEGTRRVTLVCYHDGLRGRPVQMAFDVMDSGRQFGGSAWMEVLPGAQTHITVDLDADMPLTADLLVKSTINDVQSFAWAYAKTLILEGRLR